ncbi:lipase [Helicobacter typhlonius]|uniref:lipase n=3 Tax=Helicobacter typhlonius TaxID=76936 RepID=UPI002FE34062
MNPNNPDKTDDSYKEKDYNKKTIYENITQDDIDSLTKDSPIHLLNALYQCEDYILLDENKEATVNKKSFNYTSSFYLSFLSNQDSISDEYLQARKNLYKSVNLLKKDKTFNFYNNSHTFQSQDKSIQIIFLDTSHSLSHLLHIHNNKIDIFTKDKTYLDIQELESLLQEYVNTNTESNNTKQDSPMSLDILNSPSTQIFFYSHLLTGSSEIETNPFLFGQLDKDNTIKQDTPTYHFSPKDEENNLGTLLIFLNSCTLTLLNYSLLDSSLNIKLTLTNKESKEKQDKAIIQNKQKQHKEQLKPLSTAMLHPILEDNEMKCSHGGVVQLKSNLGKSIQDKNIPFILETDLLYSSIVGCPNPPISGGPCTQVALILPHSRGLKKHNEDYPIMQSLVSSGVFSDKGVPLVCTPKANSYKINAPSPTHTKNITKEALKAQIDPTPPTLNIITPFKDLEEYYLTPSTYEERESKDSLISSQAKFYMPNNPIDIELKPLTQKEEDYQDLKDNSILESLLRELLIDYHLNSFSYRILTLRIAYTLYEYILIIPKSIPHFIHKLLKEQRNKEELSLGYGRFINLQRDYVRNIQNSTEQHYSNALTLHIQGKILLCPSGMEKVRLEVG